jgi:hypothetical protein
MTPNFHRREVVSKVNYNNNNRKLNDLYFITGQIISIFYHWSNNFYISTLINHNKKNHKS